MARLSKNSILNGFSGTIGKQIVLKNYQGKTVVTAYPDMTGVVRTVKQKGNNSLFKKAVRYAQAIIRNHKTKAAYAMKLPKGASVYHAAIRSL